MKNSSTLKKEQMQNIFKEVKKHLDNLKSAIEKIEKKCDIYFTAFFFIISFFQKPCSQTRYFFIVI